MAERSPVSRDSARVIVLDRSWRTLLVRVVDPTTDRPPVWLAAGGGIEEGEDLAGAAARELWEETGLSVEASALGSPVAFCQGEWSFRGTCYVSTDWYFALQTDGFDVCEARATPLEQELHAEWRWCSTSDIEAMDEVVIPGGLLALIGELATTGWPSVPIELPWVSG